MVIVGVDMGDLSFDLERRVRDGATPRQFAAQGMEYGCILLCQSLQAKALLNHSAPGGAHAAA